MSIRPIDMQVMIPKTAEIGKTQQTELQRNNSEQMQFADQLNKQTIQNQHQVVETNKSEKNSIKKDESKKKKNQNSKNNKKDEDSEQKEDKKNTASTSIFDIRI